jgi:DNA-directed RNA polymerase specialized sigma24 family protein
MMRHSIARLCRSHLAIAELQRYPEIEVSAKDAGHKPFRLHGRPLRLCDGLSRNPAVAADLVQETYLRALNAKTSLRASSNVKGWLFTILRNIWLNHLRHERAGPKIAELEPDETLADVAHAILAEPGQVQ